MNNAPKHCLAAIIMICLVFSPNLSQGLDLDLDRYNDFLPGLEKTISMDFTDASLKDVLKIFSQQSGLNFIAATDVASQKVQLYLDQVPVEVALERILAANNLTYELKPGSNIFVVKKMEVAEKELMTRIYNLKFATVPSSKLNSTLSSDDENQTGTDSTAARGILAAVEAVLTEDGKIIEDERTNSLIVTDIPSQFPLIEQTIARLDVRVPQILIEAEMLDISKSTADLLGAKFSNELMTYAGPSRQTLWPFDQNQQIRDLSKSGLQGFYFTTREFTTGTISFENFKITLQFLRENKDTKNLARPRILTLNNVTAEISISTDEAIGLASSTTASEGTSTSVAEAERVETGVFLKVTPQANVNTKEITMAIEPKVIQAKQGGTFGTGADAQTFKDPEERGSKSILRVRDGDTVVIGGLIRTNRESINTNVPVLSNIPVLGSAFRHKDLTDQERELIIFITPHIIREDVAGMLAPSEGIIREQSSPRERQRSIQDDLSSFENRRFDSYR